MTDDELRRAYAALRTARARPGVHDGGDAFALAAEAIEGGHDQAPREAALLAALEAGHADDLRLLQTMREAATRAAASAHPPSRWWRRTSTWLGAAALLAIAVTWPTFGGGRDDRAASPAAATERSAGGSEITVVTETIDWPVADARPTSIVWRAVPSATSYRVEVFDVDGAVIHRFEAGPDTSFTLPPRPADVPSGAAWWISARLADGRVQHSALQLLPR